ncbi:signal peptidase II [Rhizomonospora bruguierae]|uniref:signal peptidase II n=1 Tax=Rhizomonospora bruguierae TaxID=1581705 RepID=UPI0020BE06EB|nr:signal peptidase II [Micromonospora sp. NBRC 107566]
MRDLQAVGGETLNPPQAPGRRRSVGALALAAALIVLADQLTKHLALRTLDGHPPTRLFGGAVYLTLTRNSGAAFSLGRDHTFVFPLIAAAVVAWIVWMSLRLRSLPWAVALGLVLGGALGNLADRLFRAPGPLVGHVVDMVSLFDPAGNVWPVFNLADSSLVVGVTLAVLLEITGRQRDGTRVRRATREEQAATREEAGPGWADGEPAERERTSAARSTGSPERIEG